MARPDDEQDEPALADVMTAYQDGSLDAFDRLYAALEHELRRFFASRCYDASRIEDLVQETFLQIHRSRQGYLRGLPVRPWAYAIAKRVWLMYLRRVRRRESRERTPIDAIPEPQTAAGSDLLSVRSQVESALRQVPAEGRAAFLMHHWRGLSFLEIATRLGITPGAAKLRSSRAGARMRELLAEKGPGRRGK